MSPKIAAQLILLNFHDYVTYRENNEKNAPTTRFRINNKTLSKILERQRISHSFMQAVGDELLNMGWLTTYDHYDYWLFVRSKSTENWGRISFQYREGGKHKEQRERVLADEDISDVLKNLVDSNEMSN